MTRYEVLIDQRIESDLDIVPKHIVKRFLQSLNEFEKDPMRRRPRFDVKRLKGFPGNLFRFRLGDYRILYSVDKENLVVKITSVEHRKIAYK